MKLTLTVTDKVPVIGQGVMQPPKWENQDIITFTNLDAPPAVVASILRGVADEIEPHIPQTYQTGPGDAS